MNFFIKIFFYNLVIATRNKTDDRYENTNCSDTDTYNINNDCRPFTLWGMAFPGEIQGS